MAALPLSSTSAGHVFRPTDEELVDFYLRNKINGNEDAVNGIREVDLCNPWDLPAMSLMETNDYEWVFFCPYRKYGSGSRTNRATSEGYWKSTGKDRLIEGVKFHGRESYNIKKFLELKGVEMSEQDIIAEVKALNILEGDASISVEH